MVQRPDKLGSGLLGTKGGLQVYQPEQPEARRNELTAVYHRELFDKIPGGVKGDRDVARWREFRRRYHAAQRLEGESDFPLQVDFELNSTCQMRCAFCLHGQERVEKRGLSFSRFARAIDEGERYGLCSIKMNYINEPLLNRDLPRHVEYARDHGVLNVYFATNGLLLTEDVARELIRVKVSKVMISLDATTPETFLKMRRSDKLDKIVSNIHRLLELRLEKGVDYPLVRVNFLKTPVNAHESEEFIAKWSGVADMVGFQEQVGLPGVENDFLTQRDSFNSEFRCSFPFKLLVVDSAGDILPCCTFSGRSMPLGNISQLTLREAWNSKQMRDLKALHRGGDWRENSVCAHCVNSC